LRPRGGATGTAEAGPGAAAPAVPDRSVTGPARIVLAVAAAVAVLHVVSVLAAGDDLPAPLREWVHLALYAVAAAAVAVRAMRYRQGRLGWSVMAVAIASRGAGAAMVLAGWGEPDLRPLPVVPGLTWGVFAALAFAAVLLLARGQLVRAHPSLWLDGLLGALVIGALATTIAYPEVHDLTTSDADAAIGVSLLAADAVLCASCLWALRVGGWESRTVWLPMAAGFALLLAGDALFLGEILHGGWDHGEPGASLHPLGLLLIGLAAWGRPAPRRHQWVDALPMLAVPAAYVLTALALLGDTIVGKSPQVTGVLAVAALVVATARASLTVSDIRSFPENRRLARSFEDAAVGMALVTLDQRWLRVNRALARLLGRPPAELAGRPVAEVAQPDEALDGALLPRDAMTGAGVVGLERRFIRSDGGVVDTLVTASYVDDERDTGERYLFVQLQDVTGRRRSERQKDAIVELGQRALEVAETGTLLTEACRRIDRALEVSGAIVRSPSELPSGPLIEVPVPLRRPGTTTYVVGLPVGLLDPRFIDEDIRFLRVIAGVLGSALDRAGAEEAVRHQALHDPLTGLANRTLLANQLDHALRVSARSKETVGVLLLDLDRFKDINDTLGHRVGDQLLQAVAERLRQGVREGDVVARLGGDEFVVLCSDAGSEERVAELAERLVEGLEKPIMVGSNELFVSASLGIAFGGRTSTADALLRDADVAMYRAKDQGGGRFEVFDLQLRDRLVSRVELETALRGAAERGELFIVYQPIVDLDTSELAGFEALLRWNHPQRGVLLPAEFIPIAEETNLIIPIGRWVLQEVCRQMARWNAIDRSRAPIRVSVNLSVRQLTSSLVDDVRHAVESAGIELEQLVLEITESKLMEARSAAAVVDQLHELGVGLALDDFGTGYSSLGYIRSYPHDTLKLDRAFVHELGEAPDAEPIIRAVLEMADAVGMQVVAEGVEDAAQAEMLRSLHCHYAQGRFFAWPLPREEAERLIRGGVPGWRRRLGGPVV
jgi:diguanylate cyclase (GGDEF)-like protein/PAS domain S-box-containing protein